MGNRLLRPSTAGRYTAAGGIQESPELSYSAGRFPEHHAKEILRTYGLDVPHFMWAETAEQAVRFAHRIGYPVVAKVISPGIYCKSDRGGIEPWIADDQELRRAFDRFSRAKDFEGVLVEERLKMGLELNVGATKVDFRYGPAVFMESAHTQGDHSGKRTFRMPASGGWNVVAMLKELGVLPYHRREGAVESLNIVELERVLSKVAELVMDPAAGMEAIILDPVRCVGDRCVVLDARIKFNTLGGRGSMVSA